MTWSDFYDNYTNWAESTIRTRISSLEDMGSGDEIVDVVFDLPTEKLKAQLIRKAIRQNVQFTHDDFMNLDGELPDEVYRALAKHTGFDANNPYLDEENLTWDDFYSELDEWTETDILRRIGKLKTLGKPAEVCDAICNMPNSECKEALYEKAVSAKVRFTKEQLEEMGQYEPEEDFLLDNLITDADISQLEQDVAVLCDALDQKATAKPSAPPKREKTLFSILFAGHKVFPAQRKASVLPTAVTATAQTVPPTMVTAMAVGVMAMVINMDVCVVAMVVQKDSRTEIE